VQELLGHATIDMTMRYTQLSPEVKREAVRVLVCLTPTLSPGSAERRGSEPVVLGPEADE